MRRVTKYLNAREYAERLRLSENRDIQDFAEDFIEALDFVEDSTGELVRLRDALDEAVSEDDASTYLGKVKWLSDEAETLLAISDKIYEVFPQFEEYSLEDIIDGLILLKQAALKLNPKPVQEYDL
jgi:hypothetical protein